jgi:hypothetical protein
VCIEAPRTERHDRMVRGFAFDQPSPIAGQVSGLDLRGGLLYAGSSGDSRYAFNPDRKHIEPRIGVAWRFAPKWVMRGGYGLAYLGQSAQGPNTGFSQLTSLIASTDGNFTPAVSLSDPFPTSLFPTGLLQPIGNKLGLATNLGQSISAQYVDRPLPYTHQILVRLPARIERRMAGGCLLLRQPDAPSAGDHGFELHSRFGLEQPAGGRVFFVFHRGRSEPHGWTAPIVEHQRRHSATTATVVCLPRVHCCQHH